MSVPTNIQTIVGPACRGPASVADDVPPLRAWREDLGLTQAEVAARLGISQPAYAQQENSARLRQTSRERIAAALGITAAQLDI
ncbi:helix-turn-helix transcriptional regulator [Cupriavidus taiwanensis]|uniref:Transcriptional regulator, XRE-family n=1 Tax=Cupriavidus taiwanensis TaxID=164546 RepID=A0A375ISQ0_9BURK|nr:helix-turn-helix transcriptional regulator [Cupriavidus taiwanensis]SOZ29459.1 Transcriptional regulator, XRE-family [Cupriavidus taiwanensis]SPA34173.1 Transcriptional regulator, XRE-family [Cupriavidus taiwanensis]SPK76255.1 Transcriptional regulator, XRE-family [Cupriavidus taiwanensis]